MPRGSSYVRSHQPSSARCILRSAGSAPASPPSTQTSSASGSWCATVTRTSPWSSSATTGDSRIDCRCPVSIWSWSLMLESVTVIGAGRVGSAFAARLRERGVAVCDDGELRLLCVPDRAIAAVAGSLAEGPWVAHVAGATPLAALDPHRRRFSLHPLQTFTRARGAEQIDGAWAAVTAETDEARAHAVWLGETLGLRPFTLADEARPLYHAGAAIASNYLVTLYRAAERLLEGAGAPPEALVPLMRRTIENGFELTGPIARGDWETVQRHLTEIRARRPQLEPMYRTLAEV